MATRKQKAEDDWLVRVRRAKAEPRARESLQALAEALEQASFLVASEAAKVAQENELRELLPSLHRAWARFVPDGVKRDPGCRAKEATLTALDHLEHGDADVFVEAVRYRQPEPVFGGRADTAGGVRVRALDALLRRLHTD